MSTTEIAFAHAVGVFRTALRRVQCSPQSLSSAAGLSRSSLRVGVGHAREPLARVRPLFSAGMATPTYKSVALSTDVEVFIRPVLADNFSYMILERSAGVCAVVDPYSPQGLLLLAEQVGARITAVLCTHHHNDHSGGNAEIASLVPGIEIVGSKYETAPAVNRPLAHDDEFILPGGSIKFRALHTPCHTNGHLCFVSDTERPAVFTGDTLFVGGCGRFFEGDANDMQNSLNTVLGSLPDDCLVFCGHEYTVANLRFAQHVDPENKHVTEKLTWARAQIESSAHTVPSTIGEEKLHNPFMRTSNEAVAAAVGARGEKPEVVMAALRKAKNAF